MREWNKQTCVPPAAPPSAVPYSKEGRVLMDRTRVTLRELPVRRAPSERPPLVAGTGLSAASALLPAATGCRASPRSAFLPGRSGH